MVWVPDRLEVTNATTELYGGHARFTYRQAPLGQPGALERLQRRRHVDAVAAGDLAEQIAEPPEVADDHPVARLERPRYAVGNEQRTERLGYIYASDGKTVLAVLRGSESRILVRSEQIAPVMSL